MSMSLHLARIEQRAATVGVDVRGLGIEKRGLGIVAQLRVRTEADVDLVAQQFGDADPDSGTSDTYSRTASLDGVTVRIFSGRTDVRHRAGRVESSDGHWAEERAL